jgi:hypothetical protein
MLASRAFVWQSSSGFHYLIDEIDDHPRCHPGHRTAQGTSYCSWSRANSSATYRADHRAANSSAHGTPNSA